MEATLLPPLNPRKQIQIRSLAGVAAQNAREEEASKAGDARGS